MKKRKLNVKPMSLMGSLLVWIYAIILTIPLCFVLITAFKSEQERVINPIGMPMNPSFDNFVTAWTDGNLLRASINSVIISFGSTFLLLVGVVLVSYCLNRIRDTKIGVVIYMYLLSAMFIPGVGTVTRLMLRRDLGLYNNLWGEIISNAAGITTGVFLVSGFLRTIPRELEEAALMDGANDIQLCTKVIVPVILPSLVTVGIMTFTSTWNSALGPMLTLRDKNLYTIPMTLLLNFSNEISVKYTALFAGVIMTCIPIIIVYCKCQKYFVSALAGSVKG